MNEDEATSGSLSSPNVPAMKGDAEITEGQTHPSLNHEQQSVVQRFGPSQAQRAYIAHAAPHLLDGLHESNSSSNIDFESPTIASPNSNGWQNGSSGNLTDGSPIHSAQPSRSPSEEARDRSVSRGTSSPALYSNSPLHADPNKPKSHHLVPKRFRGPLPMFGDAEDIAPLPNLISSGTNDDEMYNMANYPLNRNGWRYVSAGPASESLPQTVYKTLETGPYGVHWSWADRSAFTHLSQDASVAAASNGFRSLRANVPVREGSWYVEIHILQPDGRPQNARDGNHVRLGWGRREAPLNAPVGSNGYSYGLRDTTGEKVFLSRTYPYGNEFQPGDVIGMWISLPPLRQADPNDLLDPARIERKRLPIRYKGRLYFESLELAIPKEMDVLMDRSRKGEKLQMSHGAPLNETLVNVTTGLLSPPKPKDEARNGQIKRKGGGPLPGSAPVKSASTTLRHLPTLGAESKIGFFINGKPQGIAFQNLLDFRPLKRQRANHQNRVFKTKANATRGLGEGEDDAAEDDDKVITTTSTAASIMKSRENHFDDGALGYFPMVSLYGNAKARIVTKYEQMSFPPPQNIHQVLEDVDKQQGRLIVDPASTSASKVPCRPLEDRFEEYLAELWQYDLMDEAKAQILARKRELEESSDEEDDETDSQVVNVKQQSKKSRKKGFPSSNRRASNVPTTRDHTPVFGSTIASPSSSTLLLAREEEGEEEEEEEDEEEEEEEDDDDEGDDEDDEALEDKTLVKAEEVDHLEKSQIDVSQDTPQEAMDLAWDMHNPLYVRKFEESDLETSSNNQVQSMQTD